MSLTWANAGDAPRECSRCGRPITKLSQIRQHGVRVDDKGRVVASFLRCNMCPVQRKRLVYE